MIHTLKLRAIFGNLHLVVLPVTTWTCANSQFNHLTTQKLTAESTKIPCISVYYRTQKVQLETQTCAPWSTQTPQDAGWCRQGTNWSRQTWSAEWSCGLRRHQVAAVRTEPPPTSDWRWVRCSSGLPGSSSALCAVPSWGLNLAGWRHTGVHIRQQFFSLSVLFFIQYINLWETTSDDSEIDVQVDLTVGTTFYSIQWSYMGIRGWEGGYPFLSSDIFIAIGRFSAGELLIVCNFLYIKTVI